MTGTSRPSRWTTWRSAAKRGFGFRSFFPPALVQPDGTGLDASAGAGHRPAKRDRRVRVVAQTLGDDRGPERQHRKQTVLAP